MTIPKICRWRYFPINHSNKVVKLEPYRTKKECQALGKQWDGINGAVLREILIENETAYKLLPSERVDRRGGFRARRNPSSVNETKLILISTEAHEELKEMVDSGEGQSMFEILNRLILTTDPGIQISPKIHQTKHSVRISAEAHTHLMKILNRYKIRGGRSGFTVLAIVDEILR